MNPRFRIVLWLLAAISLVGIAAWLRPGALALYYQLQGGQLLDEVVRNAAVANLGSMACNISLEKDERTHTQAGEALRLLEKSARFEPNQSQTHLLMARAHCLRDDYEKAVAAYQNYIALRPNNPLGHVELAFAYEASCRRQQLAAAATAPRGNALCSDGALQAQILDQWRKGGIVSGQFLLAGDRTFSKEDFATALHWYQRGATLGGKPPFAALFQWSVAAVLNGQPLPSEAAGKIDVHPLASATQIEGEDLYWLHRDPNWKVDYGNRLSDHPSRDPAVGVLWWAAPAVTFVDVPARGVYHIKIRVKDMPGGALKLRVERNLTPIDQFTLAPGEGAWHELETVTLLPAGVHLIGLRFLEDNGDAAIDWVRLEAGE